MAKKPTYEELEQTVIEFESEVFERKQAEKALRESEERFSAFMDYLPAVVFIKDENHRTEYMNKHMRDVLGADDTWIGRTILDISGDTDLARTMMADDKKALTAGFDLKEESVPGADGTERLYETRKFAIERKGKSPLLGGIALDITDRKKAEEAVRESTKRLDERVKELNCFYGISSLLEKPDISLDEIMQGVVDLIPPSWQYPEIACSKISVEDKEYKTENFKETNWKQSSEIFVHSKRMGALEVCYLDNRPEIDEGPFLKEESDLVNAITERLGHIIERMWAREEKTRLEAQFQQVQKMEAIATLAGGIAHEFNNALMGIMGNIDLLKMDLPEDVGRDKYFEAMKSSGHRMSRLTDQLLAYAQGGKYQPKDLKLDDFVIETLPILQHNLNPAIRIQTFFPKNISYIRADHTQMQMVLSAILGNSNEAIEDEGVIRITAGNEDLDEDFTKPRPGLKSGPYVCFTIEDDGKGMDGETRSRIFEPFFTTKFQGRGMGMAAVYGIVKNHDGWIHVDSELGKGTTVQIYLPAISAESKAQGAKAGEQPEVELAIGEGTILMIEDEDVVIEVTQAMLEWLGYRVMVAKTGKDAIHITKTFDGQIDLALLDIKLPDMEGGKVYPLIMKARPDLKVIVFSGYSIEGPARKILDAGAQDFIQKPFSLATLSEKLKEVLEGK